MAYDFTKFARDAGYEVDERGARALIASPGKFECEEPSAVWAYAAAAEGDSLVDVHFGDSSWTSLVQHPDGPAHGAFVVHEDEQGNVLAHHIRAEKADSTLAEYEALSRLLQYVAEPDCAKGEGVAFIDDPAALDTLGADTGEAVFVNDHGNATLYERRADGWRDTAALV